jgi:Asp-tRNA(Asn)/Glu-tRNA(Gln) amidotransferase A subunit family amidase
MTSSELRALQEHIQRIKREDETLHAWVAFASVDTFNPNATSPFVLSLSKHDAATDSHSLSSVRFDKLSANGDDGDTPQTLHNITVGVKDIIDVCGLPTRNGSAMFAHDVACKTDSEVVALMRRAGALIIGKTVTTELATFIPSMTLNPRNHHHTPGGSSAGSAAAVAAGHVDLALGTQTAGSILRPAAYCGVFGFKPTFGRVSRAGVLVQSPTLDTVGAFAREVPVLQRWLSVVAASSAVEFTPSTNPKIGIITNWLERASTSMRDALAHAGARMRARAWSVEEITLPPLLDGLHEAQRTIQSVEAARAYAELIERDRQENHGASKRISPALVAVLDEGLRIPEADYQRALNLAHEARTLADRLLEPFDAWLMPSAPGAAPLGLDSTGDPFFNRFAAILGNPAISVPGVDDSAGMPLGLQLIGKRNGDQALLNLANQFHESVR